MGLFGSLIGGAIGLGGTIFGGIKASQAARKAKENIERQKQENQAWYDRRYNEDATQRTDAQRILTQTQEAIRQRNRAAAGSAAVMGGTEESAAATKAANAQTLADATSQIAAQAQSSKERIEQQYMARDREYTDELTQTELQRAQGIAQAVQGVGEAGAGMAGLF